MCLLIKINLWHLHSDIWAFVNKGQIKHIICISTHAIFCSKLTPYFTSRLLKQDDRKFTFVSFQNSWIKNVWFHQISGLLVYCSVFQPFCCSGTFCKHMRSLWNPVQLPKCLYCHNRIKLWLWILAQTNSPWQPLALPWGSAEPRLKNINLFNTFLGILSN